jgi:hypothetical protein
MSPWHRYALREWVRGKANPPRTDVALWQLDTGIKIN